jgi:predicted DNA-binding transcriptional regulator AlpA
MTPQIHQLLTETQVAEKLGIKPATLRNWRWKGEGPTWTRIGRRMVRYAPDAIDSFMKGES